MSKTDRRSSYQSDYSVHSLRESINNMISQRASRPQPTIQERVNKKNKYKPFEKNTMTSPAVRQHVKQQFEQFSNGKIDKEQMKQNLTNNLIKIDSNGIDSILKQKNHLSYKDIIQNIKPHSSQINDMNRINSASYFKNSELHKQQIGPSQSVFNYRKCLEQQQGISNKVKRQMINQDEIASIHKAYDYKQDKITQHQFTEYMKNIPMQDQQYIKDIQKCSLSKNYLQQSVNHIQKAYKQERIEESLSSNQNPQYASKQLLLKQASLLDNSKLTVDNKSVNNANRPPNNLNNQVYYNKYLGEIQNLHFNPNEPVSQEVYNKLRQSRVKSVDFFYRPQQPYALGCYESEGFNNSNYMSPKMNRALSPVHRNLLNSPDNNIQQGY